MAANFRHPITAAGQGVVGNDEFGASGKLRVAGDSGSLFGGNFNNSPGEFTVSMWCKFRSRGRVLLVTDTNGDPREVEHGGFFFKGLKKFCHWRRFDSGSAGEIKIQVDHSSGGQPLRTHVIEGEWGTVNDGLWHHVVVTWDGGLSVTNLAFYKDLQSLGLLASSGVEDPVGQRWAREGVGSADDDTGFDWEFANQSNNTFHSDGEFAEMAVWNRVLPIQDLDLIYRSRQAGIPLQIQPTRLLMYIPTLDGGNHQDMDVGLELGRITLGDDLSVLPAGTPTTRVERPMVSPQPFAFG